MKAPVLIAALLLVLAAAQSAYDYGHLPDPMASHFDAGGQPDGWSSRSAFFTVYLGVVAFTQVIMLGLALLLDRLPDRMLSLPNRDHWLMPERRAATFAYIQRQMAWSAAAVMLFLLSSLQLVIRANLPGGGRLATGWLWLLLALFVTAMLAVPIRVLMRFSKR
jgi:serine/threonine-protein kinase